MVSPYSCGAKLVGGLAVTATHKPKHQIPQLPVPCAPSLQSWICSAPLAPLTATQRSRPRTEETSAGPHFSPWLRQPWAVYGPGSHTHCSPWSIREKLRRCLGCGCGLGLGAGWLFTARRLLRSVEDSFETPPPNECTCQAGEVKAQCLQDLAGSPTSSRRALRALQAGRGSLL